VCVAFFQRILNFKKSDPVAPADKRHTTRYAVGERFPVKATVTIVGRDGDGNLLPAHIQRTQDWVGRLLNLSASGASVQLHPAALAARGEPCGLKLLFEHQQLSFEGKIAHFRAHPQYTAVGVALNFPDFEIQKAYLQLMHPVTLGASLKAVDLKLVKQDAAGQKKEQYRGDANGCLTLWREGSDNTVASFEFRMPPYAVAGSSERPQLEVFIPEGTGKPAGFTKASHNEVRQLFRWVVMNLSRSVPSDARKFMEKF
jgi:hypothetical protein